MVALRIELKDWNQFFLIYNKVLSYNFNSNINQVYFEFTVKENQVFFVSMKKKNSA